MSTITTTTLLNAGYLRTNRGNFDFSKIENTAKVYKKLKLLKLEDFLNKRKDSHKKALNNFPLYNLSESIFLGASQNRYGFDVFTDDVITAKESKLFLKEVKKIELATEKAKKVPLTLEQKAKKLKFKNLNKEFKIKMEKTILECYLEVNKYSKILYRELEDILEADTSWLHTAYNALVYSMENGGIMANYQSKLRQDDEASFYGLLRKAINGYNRHENTDYDRMLASGISRDTAREIIYNN